MAVFRTTYHVLHHIWFRFQHKTYWLASNRLYTVKVSRIFLSQWSRRCNRIPVLKFVLNGTYVFTKNVPIVPKSSYSLLQNTQVLVNILSKEISLFQQSTLGLFIKYAFLVPISAAWVPISPKIVSHSLSPETNQIPVLQHLVIKYHTCLSHKPSPPAAQPPRSLPQLMWHFLSFGQGVLGTRGTSSQGESCGLDGACRYCRPRLHQPAGE